MLHLLKVMVNPWRVPYFKNLIFEYYGKNLNSVHLLDIGCAWGNNIVDIHDRFARLGRKVVPYGIEISRHLASVSNERVAKLGGKVIRANAIDATASWEPDSIHVVIMSSFL